jgi:hypothetical protein
MRALPLAGALVVACIPAPHAIEGTPCDGPDPCPAPWVCQANLCASSLDAGARNVLCDPSFEAIAAGGHCSTCWCPHRLEDGGTLVVETVADSGAVLRSGIQSALVTGTATSADYGLSSAVVTETFDGNTWACSSAWVQSASADVVPLTGITMTLRYVDGTLVVWYGDAGTASELQPGPSWGMVSNRFQPEAGTVAINIDIIARELGTIGAPFYVDDAALWLSADGGCAGGP